MKNNKATLVSFLSLVAFLVLARIIPHPPNFTPVLGMAIFAPFLFRDLFVAIALPLAAMVLSNLVLGFHSSMFWVFLSITLITVVAHWAKMHTPTLMKTAGMVVGATLSFYLITNFAVWAMGGLYPMTPEGLMTSYIAAIPFYGKRWPVPLSFPPCFLDWLNGLKKIIYWLAIDKNHRNRLAECQPFF